jgi:phosphoribosylglycinamide formyltransferase-1
MKVGILGSGKGSNAQAILAGMEAGRIKAEVGVVISDVVGAGIIEMARSRGTPYAVVVEPRFRTRLSATAEGEVVRLLRDAEVDLVVLAGYMRMVKEPMLAAFPRRIINIHPSLLPAFRGLGAWRQAIEAGVAVTGCTVHYVDEGMDTGAIIAQAEVPVEPGDTPESLHARIQLAEHALYPDVVARFARGELP